MNDPVLDGGLVLPLVDHLLIPDVEKYDESEPRDESGKWTEGVGHQPIHFDFDKGGWTTHDGAPVYHGTTDKAIKQILKEGLLASKAGTIWSSFSKKGYTYLGDDENVAAQWAHDAIRQEVKNWRLRNDASEPEPRHKAALIEIVVPKEYLDQIEPDRHFRLDSDTARTLQFKGDIKPEWITHAWIMTEAGSDRTVGPKAAPKAWKQIKSGGYRMIACVLLPEPVTPE